MSDIRCPHRELAVGWALHCLEPDEAAAFARHLGGCGECARVVAETEEVGAILGSGVPQVDPPADLGRRILAAAEQPAAPVPAPVPELRPGRRRPGRKALAVAAAMVVLAGVSVGLGVRVAQLDSDRDDLVAQRTAESAVIADILDRAADPGAARTALVTPEGTPTAVMFGRGADMMLMPVHLPANDPDRNTYVIWGLGVGNPRALGLFDIDGDDRLARPVRLAVQQPAGFTGFAVSLEQGRTAPTSPSEVMATGRVDS